MKYAEMVHRCFRCGYCKFTSDYRDLNCPSYVKRRFESFSPGGRMWLISGWLRDEVKWSEHLAEIMYSCTTCNNCVEECVFKFSDYLVDIIIWARQEMVEQGLVPPAVRDYLKNIQNYGNPFKAPPEDRGLWAENTGMKTFDRDEYLFFVGCVGSYDERGKKISASVGRLMAGAGLSAGILGSSEVCDGNEARVLGEATLFEHLARRNIEKFREVGAKKIVALSPHAYHALKNLYPLLGGDFSASHYTAVLLELLKKKKISPGRLDLRVTYHDPCYLGRHNREYSAPRRVLQSIPGISLVEMDRNEKNALCCGGGGNFFTDILGGGGDSPAAIRVREAAATGAGVLAVACPNCARMLEDAVRSEGLEDSLQVRDVAEILEESVGKA